MSVKVDTLPKMGGSMEGSMEGRMGGRTKKARKPNAWAKAAGEYYNANKAKFDSFSDVLKSPKFRAYYNKKYKGKKVGGGVGDPDPTDDDTTDEGPTVSDTTDEGPTVADPDRNTISNSPTVTNPTDTNPVSYIDDTSNTDKEPDTKGGKKKSAKKSAKKASKKSRKSKKRFFGLM
jgi:hypothetical protein